MVKFKDAEVYTLEGKKIGRISEIDSNYFTAYKHGLLTDEEFRIPVSAISAVENYEDGTVVRINMNEEQVRHGFEFASGRPNSEFMHGSSESEPKMPLEKQVIHYESVRPTQEQSAAERPPAISQYLCDMCDEKFKSPDSLQEHRAERHKAATGI